MAWTAQYASFAVAIHAYICQHPSTRAQAAVGYNKAKGQMGYL